MDTSGLLSHTQPEVVIEVYAGSSKIQGRETQSMRLSAEYLLYAQHGPRPLAEDAKIPDLNL